MKNVKDDIKSAVHNEVSLAMLTIAHNYIDLELYSYINSAVSIRSDINLPVYTKIFREIQFK